MASFPPSKKKVLVVDDEPSIVTYLTTVLEDAGYETCAATAPEEAWATAQEERPDVITLDIMMPKRSGFALYQDFKLDPVLRDTPVVFVTAFSRTDDLWSEAFRRVVPDGRIPLPEAYIEKPISVEVFLETVEFVVRCAASRASTGKEELS